MANRTLQWGCVLDPRRRVLLVTSASLLRKSKRARHSTFLFLEQLKPAWSSLHLTAGACRSGSTQQMEHSSPA